jgi:hypothetical protein
MDFVNGQIIFILVENFMSDKTTEIKISGPRSERRNRRAPISHPFAFVELTTGRIGV